MLTKTVLSAFLLLGSASVVFAESPPTDNNQDRHPWVITQGTLSGPAYNAYASVQSHVNASIAENKAWFDRASVISQ